MKILQTLLFIVAISDANAKKQAGHQKLKGVKDVDSEAGASRLSKAEEADEKYQKYLAEMDRKKQLLEQQEAGKHSIVGDLYTKTTSAIAATPLVGSAINTTTGLVKTTLGGVKSVTQRIGLKKYDVSPDGVV